MLKARRRLSILLQQADVRPQVTSHLSRDDGRLDKSADAYT